ncbi:MAG: hypothetical protein QOH23_2549, partial [Gaiellaceae bacterium]|nr:hypothetical protein [Gaiellaceae bacterium]
ALVVPSPDMSAVPPVSAIDPVVYSGGVTTSLTPCGLVGNGGGGGTKAAAGAKLTGGGQVGFASTPTGNFEVNIISTTSGFKGKVQVSSTSCSFRSDVIDVFSPEAKGASFGGWGHFKDTPNAQVRFSGQAQDNGQGDKATDPDFITVDKCSVQGQVVHGNITWHSS